MDLITKLEIKLLNLAKSLPHLPLSGQKWLGVNVWWLVLIAAVFSAIALLNTLAGLSAASTLMNSTSLAYLTSGYSRLAMMSLIVSLVFVAINTLLLALSIKPLKAMEKKGWVLLFIAFLVQVIAYVVNAVLSFSILGFLLGIIYGAVVTAIMAYFLFEIHGQFAHKPKATIKKH